MGRPNIYDDNQRKIKKTEANNKIENIEKRRLNALKYYEKKKLEQYIELHNNDIGFKYKYLKPTINFIIDPVEEYEE